MAIGQAIWLARPTTVGVVLFHVWFGNKCTRVATTNWTTQLLLLFIILLRADDDDDEIKL